MELKELEALAKFMSRHGITHLQLDNVVITKPHEPKPRRNRKPPSPKNSPATLADDNSNEDFEYARFQKMNPEEQFQFLENGIHGN